VAATLAMLVLLDRELAACREELRRRVQVLEAIRRVAIGGIDSPVGVAATS
jgi:predicted nuclease with RNAse H fold